MANAIESAVLWALNIAADNSHGYDQGSRWGADYDCSSLVISAYEQAGVPVKTKGATYTGNMYKVFLACGFKDVTASCNLATGAGCEYGDVLLNTKKHTALHIGNGYIVHARGNENGGALGGKTGDQTGGEIRVQSYYNSPWDYVLRYGETRSETPTPATPEKTTGRRCEDVPTCKRGLVGITVLALQHLLNGYDDAGLETDGDFGPLTEAAVKKYQARNNLDVDGVVGPLMWGKLLIG